MLQTFIFAMIFLSVAGLVLGIGLWLNRNEALDRRLGQLGNKSNENSEQVAALWQAKVAKITAPLAWLSTPKEGWDASNFRIRLMQAGLRGPGWPVIIFAAKTALSLTLPILFLLFNSMGSAPAMSQGTLFYLLILAALGYYFPNLVLAKMISLRKRELEESMPDAVDLMTVCVEAGLGLDAAMNRAGEEIQLRSQVLADELRLVGLEMRVGSTRENALRNFALRTGVDDIATFVTILLQSGHFGTNVADSLRVLSETMRERRKIRAEERAAKIPLKLLFPLIFFIFPSMFLVLLGPPLMGIFRVLFPALTGGG